MDRRALVAAQPPLVHQRPAVHHGLDHAARRYRAMNLHPSNAKMRRAFAGLPMRRVGIRYTVGGQRRPTKSTGELIIASWKPAGGAR